MKSAYDIIIRPIITEQSMEQNDINKYAFEVARDANKIEIKKAVEEIYKVKVASVNVVTVPGKRKRVRTQYGYTADWKKVVVTLKENNKIEVA